MESCNTGLPQEYFPLKTGLYWIYRYKGLPRQPIEIDLRIIQEKEIEGKLFFRFSSWFYLTRSVAEQEVWIAWQDGSVYRWDGKSQILVFGNDVEHAELKKNDPAVPVETAAGSFSDLYRFQDCIGCADAGNQFSFARNMGIVNVTMNAIWGAASYELIETNATEANPR